MDEPAHPMARRSIDTKVRRGFAGTNDLGANSGVAWMQSGLVERRKIAPDSRDELVAMAVVERIVHGIDPPDIGPKSGLSRQIERNVHAKSAGFAGRLRGPCRRRVSSRAGAASDAAALLEHADDLLTALRRLHEDIRARVGARLEQARASGRPELANEPGEWGAGDIAYALDDEAEHALAAFGPALGQRHPLVLVDEDKGVRRFGEGAPGPPLRVLVDPVDGTRSLMHDMRSAWAVSCVAPDRGSGTRLSDAS